METSVFDYGDDWRISYAQSVDSPLAFFSSRKPVSSET